MVHIQIVYHLQVTKNDGVIYMMKKGLAISLQIGMLGYIITHFLTSFYHISFFEQLLPYFGLILFIFSVPYVSIRKFKLPLTLLIAAIIILTVTNESIFNGILDGLLVMRELVGFLAFIPLISWVLREESYIEDIISVFYKLVNTSRKFYFGIVGFTQVIAYFLLFASIPMMYQFVNVILKDQKTIVWEQFKGTALLRGFSMASLWVISIPSFIFATEILGATLSKTILQGATIALIGTTIATIFSMIQERKSDVPLTPVLQKNIENILVHASNEKLRKRNVIEFAILFFSLFGTIFLIHGFFNLRLMLTIPMTIVVWIVTFYIVKGRMNKFAFIMKEYVQKEMLHQAYSMSIMLSVGVLIFALRKTPFATVVIDGLHYLQNHLPFINPLFLLPFIIILFGFFGMGPLTVMVLVAGILGDLALPYPPELLVLSITSGSAISILLSPFIMPVIVLSEENKLSLFTNGIKFNWKFALVFYVIVQLYIQTAVHLT